MSPISVMQDLMNESRRPGGAGAGSLRRAPAGFVARLASHVHGRWIHGQRRLKSLHAQWPNADPRVLSAFATVLAEQSTLRKWDTVKEKWQQFTDDHEELPSVSTNGSGVPVLGDPDPRLLRLFGLFRSQWNPRERVPRRDRPAAGYPSKSIQTPHRGPHLEIGDGLLHRGERSLHVLHLVVRAGDG